MAQTQAVHPLLLASTLLLSCSGGGPISVNGRLLTLFKDPVSGIAIVISGKPAVNTDTNGAFSIGGVTPPYDLSIVDGAHKSVTVYQGLTRSDPTLYYNFSPSTHQASVTGAISAGGVYPQTSGYRTIAELISTRSKALGILGPFGDTDAAGNYAFSLPWSGPSTINGTIQAVQIRDSSPGVAVEYKGYGKRDVTVSDGATLNAQNVSLSAISSSTLSGSATAPAGYSLTSKGLFAANSAGVLAMSLDASNSTTFSFVSPNVAELKLAVEASAQKQGVASVQVARTGLAGDASGVSLTLPQAAEPILPVDGATGVQNTTSFSWSAMPGGVHEVIFSPRTGGKPVYFVITAGTTATIPDGTSFGLGLPSATGYTWTVFGAGGFSSIDSIATDAFLDWQVRSQPGDFVSSFSSSRSFTTP